MEVRPGYKKTEVGVIPEDWCVRKIRELCEYQNGTSLERFFNHVDGLKVISIGNYSVIGSYIDNGVYISLKHKKNVGKFVLRQNDLTMSLNDKTSAGAIIGRVLLIEQDDLFVFNQRTMRLRPKHNVSPAYLHHTINADRAHSALVDLAKPGTQIYINTDDVIDLALPVPPFPEQEAIAEALSDVDAHIEFLEQLVAKKRHVKRGVMQELLTARKRLPKFSGNWVMENLSNVGVVTMGQSPPGSSYSTNALAMPLLNGAADLTAEGITVSQYTNSPTRVSKSGDLLFCIRATIGNRQVADREYCLGRGVAALTVNAAYDCAFIGYQLDELFGAMSSQSEGGVIKGLRKDDVGAFKIRLPMEKAEQAAIATILSDMDKEIAALEVKLTKARQLKQGMMQELLTGRIRLV